MDTLIIQLTNSKARKLLKDMEDMNLIRVLEQPVKISSLRNKIKKKMSNEEIDQQLKSIRTEWQRDI